MTLNYTLVHSKPKRGRSPAKESKIALSPAEAGLLLQKRLITRMASTPDGVTYHSTADLRKIQEVRTAVALVKP
jgi:hypothetical protein